MVLWLGIIIKKIGLSMNEFEKELMKKYKENDPKIFEMAMFLMAKINRFNRDMKILIYILISLVLPIYLLVFQFIFKK